MTIAYPDVSNHEGGMVLEAGTVAVCAKASEGTGYTDPFYGHYKVEAARIGAVFFGYHFLRAGGGAAQADYCFGVTGPGVNVMIDHEPTTGSNPSVQDAVDFAARFRARGGLCTLDYLPHWYWQQLGSPSLVPLAAAGLSLVSSNYTAYSDTGAGWAGYGGLNPAVWQYTDALAYSGQNVDFNAYRGTVDQLRILLGYEGAPTMDWSDVITGPNGRPSGNSVADILTDLGRLRDALFGDPTALAPFPATSPLQQLVALAAAHVPTELTSIAAEMGQIGAPDPAAFVAALVADTAALQQFAQAVAPLIPAPPTADQIAAAVAKHLGADLQGG